MSTIILNVRGGIGEILLLSKVIYSMILYGPPVWERRLKIAAYTAYTTTGTPQGDGNEHTVVIKIILDIYSIWNYCFSKAK